MIVSALFFLFAFATLAAMMWSGFMLFRSQDDPLGDRLEELQAHAMVAVQRQPRRRGGGGFLNSFLYIISLIPGGTTGCATPSASWLRRGCAAARPSPTTPSDRCCSWH